MTPQQRQDAARKAAATRRANRANGVGPQPKRAGSAGPRRSHVRPTGPAFAPRPSADSLMLVALAALEDAVKAKFGTVKATPEQDHAWRQYQKVKALALHPASGATQDLRDAAAMEARAALRTGSISLLKLVL